MKIVHHDNDRWRILGIGATREDGKVYVHLASVTRWRQQRNGRYPIQMADWFDQEILESAEDADPITYAEDHSQRGIPPHVR